MLWWVHALAPISGGRSSRSIQRRLERTGVVALLLGYGLLLAVNLQVFESSAISAT